jgi:hypothetical protein
MRLLAMLLLVGTASATNYYVRTDGNNANNGLTNSAGGAKLTINGAYSIASYGDVVNVAPGTYASFTMNHTCTSGSRLAVVCTTKWSCNIPVENWTGPSYNTLQGFEVDGTRSPGSCCGIDLHAESGFWVLNNKIHDTASSCNSTSTAVILFDAEVTGDPSTPTLGANIADGNFLYHNNCGTAGSTANNSGQHGIYSVLSNDILRNNIVVDQGGGWCLHAFHAVDNWTVVNNTLANCQNGGIAIGGGGSTQNNTTITNNFVVNSGSSATGNGGINFRQCGTSMVGQNNAGYGNTPSLYVGTCSGITQGGTQVGSNASFVNYTGSNPDTADFHLANGSVGINTGTTTCAPGHSGCVPAVDFDGNGRIGTPTIGAYTFTGTNDFYVSPSGSDSNDGSQAHPWATFRKANASFTVGSAGTIIHFANGTYAETPTLTCAGAAHTAFCITHGGTSTQRVTFQCDHGLFGAAGHPGSPGACLLRSTADTANQELLGIQGSNFVTVQGFDIGGDGTRPATLFQSGILVFGKEIPNPNGNGVFLDYNFVHNIASQADDGNGKGPGCPSEGMIVGDFNNSTNPQKLPVNGELVGNWIDSGGTLTNTSCNQFHGTYISGPGWKFENNIVGNVPGAAMKIYPNVCSEIVTNNFVYHAGWWGILVYNSNTGCGLSGFTVGNTTVSNNIAINNGFNAACSGIQQQQVNQGTNRFAHNILLGNAPNDNINIQNSSGSCLNTALGGTIGTINGGTGATLANTLVSYLDNGQGNYRLTAGSQGIGAGDSTCVPGGISPCIAPIDLTGITRPSGGAQDIGIYVFSGTGAPIVSLTPSPLDFGTIPVSSSSTLTATLKNTGTTNLTFSAPTINSPVFTIANNHCVSPLAASLGCAIDITATPTASGIQTANLTLNDNAAGTPHQLPLRVTGGTIAVTFNPTSLSFPVTAPASCSPMQTYAVISSGSLPLIVGTTTLSDPNFQFGGAGTCTNGTSLSPGQSCNVTVKFCPTTAGAESGNAVQNSNAPGAPNNIPLTGTGGAAVLTLTPGSGSCGSHQIGTSSTCQAFTLTSTGNLDATGILPGLTGTGAPAYSQTNDCPANQILAPSAFCTITVFFKPTSAGPLTASLNVTSNAPAVTSTLSGTGVAPATLVLNPQTVNFGPVLVGTTTPATPIKLTNQGGSSATISSIVASASFAQTNDCPGALAPAAFCTIQATATPGTTGAINGTITVTDSASGSPHIASLSVLGVAPVVSFTPSTITFPGNQAVGTQSAPINATFANTGTGPVTFVFSKVGAQAGDFVLLPNACTSPMPAGQSCLVPVAFKPTTSGARSMTLRSTDSATGSPHDIAVSGTAVTTAPAVCLSVTSVSFGNQPVGTTSAARQVIVTNCGSANLVISAITPTGNFSSTGCITTVSPGTTCTISATFSPLSAGTLTGQLSIASNAATSPTLVGLQGFGTQTGASLTSAAAFGHVIVGQNSAPVSLTLTNTGNQSITPMTPVISGTNAGDFSFSSGCGTLAPNATCQIAVTFKPTGTGSRTATLTQSFSGGVTSVTSALSGTGDPALPLVCLLPSSLDFGNVTVSSPSSVKTVQITNCGNSLLTFTSNTLTGANAAEYSRTNNCPITLAPGAVCTTDVSVTPTGTGARVANLHLIDDAASSPQDVPLTVNGVASPAPKITLTPASVGFSPPSIQTTTTSAAQVINARNDGNADLVFSGPVTLGGSNPGDFIVSDNCGTVAAGNSCSATVNCKPTAVGSRTATAIFSTNASTSPDSINLSCTAFVGTPLVILAVNSINFGNTVVGTVSGPAVFTLSNTGLATATGVVISSGSSDFTVTDNCGGSIAIGGSCSAAVRFAPIILCGQFDPNDTQTCISNVHLGQISVVSNTANSPQSVSLQGTALAPPPPPGPITLGYGGKVVIGGAVVTGVQ